MRNVWMCQCSKCGWIGIDEADTKSLAVGEENEDCCPECWENDLEVSIVDWEVKIDGIEGDWKLGEYHFQLKEKKYWWEH